MMMEVLKRERRGVLVLPRGSWGGLHSSRAGGGRLGRNTLWSHHCKHRLNWDQSDHRQPLRHRSREVHILSLGTLRAGDAAKTR